MKRAIIIVITFLLMLTACDNAADSSPDSPIVSNPQTGSPADSTYTPYAIAYSAVGPDVSRFLEWEWAKDGTDFVWLFQTDGTVSVIHCCGEVYNRQFNYLFEGSVLITYGHETSFDEIIATGFTMAEDGLSFTRDNGQRFTRRNARDTSSSGTALVLSNDLLGTWRGDDGTEYVFDSDSGLLINSGQYGYFIRYAELLTLGVLVDGTQAVLQKYKFNRSGKKLYLRCSDGQKYTLSLSE